MFHVHFVLTKFWIFSLEHASLKMSLSDTNISINDLSEDPNLLANKAVCL